jgi:subtilisin family serine protease
MTQTKRASLPTLAMAFPALLVAFSAGSAVPAQHKASPGGGQLMAFGGRSAEQQRSPSARKLDAALADLTRHLNRVRSERALEDLHSLNPAAHFMQRSGSAVPLVAVDAVTRGDPARLKEFLVGLGMQHATVYSNDVGGWLPVSQIATAAARTELVSMRASMWRTRAAKASSQGDFAQRSDVLRANNAGLNGAGVTVGILSDSFNCYGVYDKPGSGVPASGVRGYAPFGFASDDASFDAANGYLPASVNVLSEGTCMQYGQPLELPFADEGRAMMQIVHEVAPGAALAFHTGSNTEADFAAGITALAAAGATVIADDIGYFDEPFFQDGIVAQAIDAANAQGVAYFSAAGNNGQLSYENSAPSFTTAGTGANTNEMLLTFGMNGGSAQTFLPINVPAMFPGQFMGLIVQWDQPYVTGAPGSPGASSQIDFCITGAPANSVVFNLDGAQVTCTRPNSAGVDSVQVLILGNPASNNSNTSAQTVHLIIGLENGSPAPGLIKVVIADDGAGSTIGTFTQSCPTQPGAGSSYGVGCPTIQGHPGAAGAAAVGAAFFPQTPRCGTSPALLEYFSSAGGDAILFDKSGARLAAPQHRQKPEFVGPDGGNSSFFGFPLSASSFNDSSSVPQCANDATYNNFFGTSAATPHVAGTAALMRQANPALTPAQIYNALQSTALPMPAGNPTPDYLSGYGFVQADAAMGALPAGPPVLKLSSSTIYLGQSSTLSWLAVNSTACTASGSWSGAQAVNGSQVLTPAATGSYTYTLTCTSGAGSQGNSVNLTVQSVPALGITSTSLPDGKVGMAYQAVLAATGGIPPLTWSITSGSLPAGLTLNASTGTISGTPTAAVSAAALTLQVSDSEKSAQKSSANLSLTIAAASSGGGGGGGGGGGLDALTLLALIGLGAGIQHRRMRALSMRS